MSRRPVHELWVTFKRQCIPATASAVQRQCMRDAFYAGALALFQTMNESVSKGEEITADDIGMMEAIEADICGYPDRREREAP